MTEEGVVTLLRRYSVESDAWEPFLETWRKIATIRQRHGFEVVCAFVDRETNMFTWAISYRRGVFNRRQSGLIPRTRAMKLTRAITRTLIA
jgi:hypothetical protein